MKMTYIYSDIHIHPKYALHNKITLIIKYYDIHPFYEEIFEKYLNIQAIRIFFT